MERSLLSHSPPSFPHCPCVLFPPPVSPPLYSTRLEPFPENPEEALALDPLPPTVAGRKVIIAQKSKPATTSGTGGGLHTWNLTFKQQVWNRNLWK